MTSFCDDTYADRTPGSGVNGAATRALKERKRGGGALPESRKEGADRAEHGAAEDEFWDGPMRPENRKERKRRRPEDQTENQSGFADGVVLDAAAVNAIEQGIAHYKRRCDSLDKTVEMLMQRLLRSQREREELLAENERLKGLHDIVFGRGPAGSKKCEGGRTEGPDVHL